MTTIAVEPLSSIQPGVVELMYDNWIETGCHQDCISLEPDWDAYRRAEELGRFVAIGVRDEGTLIG